MKYGPHLDFCVCQRSGQWPVTSGQDNASASNSDHCPLGTDHCFIDILGGHGDHLPAMRPFYYKDGDDGWALTEDFHLRIRNRVFSFKTGLDRKSVV